MEKKGEIEIVWQKRDPLSNFVGLGCMSTKFQVHSCLIWSGPAAEIWHFFFAKLAESNCYAVKLLVQLQIRISQRIMHLFSRSKKPRLFSRGKKPRLDNFVVLLTKKNFHGKDGRKIVYFSLDCRYTPEMGTKSAPPGVGQKRGKTNSNETH